jgi:hypothetical protein
MKPARKQQSRLFNVVYLKPDFDKACEQANAEALYLWGIRDLSYCPQFEIKTQFSRMWTVQTSLDVLYFYEFNTELIEPNDN